MKLFTCTKDQDSTVYTIGKLGYFSLSRLKLKTGLASLVLGQHQKWAVLGLEIHFREPTWLLALEITTCSKGWLELSLHLPGMWASLSLGTTRRFYGS